MYMALCTFHFMYKLRKVFAVLKMIIMTKTSEFMSEDQFDVGKVPNLKMEFYRVFKGLYFAEMINP